MKLLFILFFAICLSACATSPAERRKNPPNIVTSSKKSAKEVAICIADKWENTQPFMAFYSPPVNTSLKMKGYSITVSDSPSLFGGTTTSLVADITENQLESTTSYYRPGNGSGWGSYDQAVRDCQ